MDTKARIGLFAGGLVLVGMVAYVMMPRAAAPKADEATASTDAAPATVDFSAAAPTTRPAATQPVAIADPFAAPAATSAGSETAGAAAPAQGAAVAAVPAVDANDAWARALDTGSTQTHSGGSLSGSSSLLSTANTLSAPAADHSAAPSQKTYKVEAGDSPVSISTKVYGSAKYASKIMAANPSVNAKRLKIGQELKLPDVATEPTSVVAGSADHTDPVPAHAATAKTYKVQSGDTLTKISARLYGKGDLWKKLYAANKSKIGSDPTHLRAGMVLQVPDNVQ